MQSVLSSIADRGSVTRRQRVKGLISVSLSCGVAECSAGETTQSLIGRADEALYDAKRKGEPGR